MSLTAVLCCREFYSSGGKKKLGKAVDCDEGCLVYIVDVVITRPSS